MKKILLALFTTFLIPVAFAQAPAAPTAVSVTTAPAKNSVAAVKPAAKVLPHHKMHHRHHMHHMKNVQKSTITIPESIIADRAANPINKRKLHKDLKVVMKDYNNRFNIMREKLKEDKAANKKFAVETDLHVLAQIRQQVKGIMFYAHHGKMMSNDNHHHKNHMHKHRNHRGHKMHHMKK